MKKKIQVSDHLLTASLLAMVGGFLDAYTYICRGGVFANAQTGNIVLFGISLSRNQFAGAVSYLIPIVAFAVGILLANGIRAIFNSETEKQEHKASLHWRQIIVAMEVCLLCIVANIPQGNLNSVANVIVSFVCALQVESFRKVKGYAYATTMCTGNLRSGTEQIYEFLTTKDRSKLIGGLHYYGIILVFILGAVIGAILSKWCGIEALYGACIILCIVFLLMFKRKL